MKKLFDGRPTEWSSSGYEIRAFDGYWTLDACKNKCQQTPGCREFRVKKGPWVNHSGCVLMKSGTTRSGDFTAWYTMYELVPCPGKKQAVSEIKLFNE